MLGDEDQERLRFCDALGAKDKASTEQLVRCMGYHRATVMRMMAVEIAHYRLAEHEREAAAQDVQEILSPPLGRELGRSPIPTLRREEPPPLPGDWVEQADRFDPLPVEEENDWENALLWIVSNAHEPGVIRVAAKALLGGEVKP